MNRNTDKLKVASDLSNIVHQYTPDAMEPDNIISSTLILPSHGHDGDLEDVPELYTPRTGKLQMKCTNPTFHLPYISSGKGLTGASGVRKVFLDGESYYNSGTGHAFDSYGIDPSRGAVVIVRPDMCKCLDRSSGVYVP